MEAGNGSTEQMVQYGKYIYCTCWSYQNSVIKIDTETDRVVDRLTVGIQPSSIAIDRNDKLWVLTDGGYDGSPYGYEAPTICRIDAETFAIEKRYTMRLGESPSELQLNGDRDKLLWINGGIWCMEINADALPAAPLIEERSTIYYGLTVNPDNGEIYVADAIDYQQRGIIYRYTPAGSLIDQFYAGINPGAFCWN
jgi:YVTN family beta-propeller protein